MRRYYPAIIDRNKNATPGSDGEIGGVYGVTFPDIPGCYGAGDNLEIAINNAREALETHLSVMTEEGMELPASRSLEDISIEKGLDVAMIAMIDILLPGKPTRVNISMDSNLLEEIDAASSNRSAFLAEGARVLLGRGGIGRVIGTDQGATSRVWGAGRPEANPVGRRSKKKDDAELMALVAKGGRDSLKP